FQTNNDWEAKIWSSSVRKLVKNINGDLNSIEVQRRRRPESVKLNAPLIRKDTRCAQRCEQGSKRYMVRICNFWHCGWQMGRMI
ncbi:Pleckstrin domain containing protein, partial [Parasponia andersonii]